MLANFKIKFGHLANRVWRYWLLIASIVRLSIGKMASKLTRKKKKKKEEPPNDDGVNLSVEYVNLSKEKKSNKKPPNDDGVNLSIECVKISKDKNTKKRKGMEDELIDMNKVLKINDEKTGEASNKNRFLYERGTAKIEENEGGKMECGICKQVFTRIFAHLNKSNGCGKNFDLNDFKTNLTKFNDKKRQAKSIQKRKITDKEKVLKDHVKRQNKYVNKKKVQNEEQTLKDHAKRQKKFFNKKKAENEEQTMNDQAERQQKCAKKKKLINKK